MRERRDSESRDGGEIAGKYAILDQITGDS